MGGIGLLKIWCFLARTTCAMRIGRESRKDGFDADIGSKLLPAPGPSQEALRLCPVDMTRTALNCFHGCPRSAMNEPRIRPCARVELGAGDKQT